MTNCVQAPVRMYWAPCRRSPQQTANQATTFSMVVQTLTLSTQVPGVTRYSVVPGMTRSTATTPVPPVPVAGRTRLQPASETTRLAACSAPTMRPQAAISRDRLVARLRHLLPGHVKTRDGYIVELGKASVRFLSADPDANARGQTASLLLVANEAQDISPDVWDPVFDPMAVSTNATTLFMGTPWNKETLLYRQMRFLEQEQAKGNQRLVWRVPWRDVAKDYPGYAKRVEARIAQFGADHPHIRTEYELQELDGEESLFSPRRITLMQGSHPRRFAAEPGKRYALLIDVAGEDEGGGTAKAFASARRRDATALTVVEIDSQMGLPTMFRTVDRRIWIGPRHTELRDQLAHLARDVWRADRVVIDATGIGNGLASFLTERLADRSLGKVIAVEKFVFSQTVEESDGLGFHRVDRYRTLQGVPG